MRLHRCIDPQSEEIDPAHADCAIFYSITNCQDGLRGISFGNLLIKQVVHELEREFPRLRTFATLSPIPGFRAWLADVMRKNAAVADQLADLQNADWHAQPAVAARMRPLLMSLCAWYLTTAKRNGEPLDAVARFHLGNGARMERLNWLADTSNRGIEQAAGMMVNYVYRLAEVERNHEAYVHEREVVASHAVNKARARLRAVRAAGSDDGVGAHAGPPSGRLAENVVHFARVLRGAGMAVGPDRVIDALNALEYRGSRAPRRFLLDAGVGIHRPPRAAAALRPGVPDFLARPRFAGARHAIAAAPDRGPRHARGTASLRRACRRRWRVRGGRRARNTSSRAASSTPRSPGRATNSCSTRTSSR